MKEFIEDVAKRRAIQRTDLLEKDMRIHWLLSVLAKDRFFSRHFVFKGGTCLILCYLGHYRFSEDIDFTWRPQSVFSGKSQKEIRRMISDYKERLGALLETIARVQGFDFRLETKNTTYVEFGGGNKTITFKLWYESEMLMTRSFIKVQINFVDLLLFAIRKRRVHSLLEGTSDKELAVLFDEEYQRYTTPVSLATYDIKEIICEKVRAILTRQGVKARDFVDVFLLEERYGIRVRPLAPQIVEKTRFILALYEKYKRNLDEKRGLIASGELFRWGTEQNLLLESLDEGRFYRFVQRFQKELQDIVRLLPE
ncbi:MAG: nucleotidyl transferase AbiEii/AbiGii toxin family protein [Candidatus Thermoplasmatota archaeon]|nr:nucleotidyl transferase AbiEii/AbiGii toxin family protein [Candidatus Thermoplasmatota archaeon]